MSLNEETNEQLSLASLKEKLSVSFSQQSSQDLEQLKSFNEKSAKWHTLNTLMIINNNKKIESLQNLLNAERARLKFVEDKSEQMAKQIQLMKFAIMEAGGKLRNYHRNLMTVITLLKLTTQNYKRNKSSGIFERIRSALPLLNWEQLWQRLSHAGLTLIIALLVSKMLWIDSIIEGMGKILLMVKLSRSSVQRTKLGMRISAIIFIFVMLRKRFESAMSQFKTWVNIFF